MTQTSSTANGSASEFIAFRIGVQEFCIDIMAVREIRGWTPATALPHAPSYVRGVINLRGSVLPIVDLSERLGFPRTETNARQVIIVVQIRAQINGLLVDAVSDILSQSTEAIQPTPTVAKGEVESFIRGVMAVDGRMIGLIDLDSLIPAQTEDAA
jgi:purine-binding chemotaxis protein CheW